MFIFKFIIFLTLKVNIPPHSNKMDFLNLIEQVHERSDSVTVYFMGIDDDFL